MINQIESNISNFNQKNIYKYALEKSKFIFFLDFIFINLHTNSLLVLNVNKCDKMKIKKKLRSSAYKRHNNKKNTNKKQLRNSYDVYSNQVIYNK